MPRAHKDDVVKYVKSQPGPEGSYWVEGAGGDLYFPQEGRPHLHLKIKSGFNDFQNLVEWFEFLVVSRPEGEGYNTNLVRDGAETGEIDNLGSGWMKTMATSICRELPAPEGEDPV